MTFKGKKKTRPGRPHLFFQKLHKLPVNLLNYKVAFASIGKTDQFGQIPNEDNIRKKNPFCVADGAGSGIFSGEWSAWLCKKLPGKPIKSAAQMDQWIDTIWEEFYDRYRLEAAKNELAQTFLYHGSFSTLAAVWMPPFAKQKCSITSYGDSVVMIFDLRTEKMIYCSIKKLDQFLDSPSLVNWNQRINKNNFEYHEMVLPSRFLILIASDALAQYLLFSYFLTMHNTESISQINQIRQTQGRLSVIIEKLNNRFNSKISFFSSVLSPLILTLKKTYLFDYSEFTSYVENLKKEGLLASDDYTLMAINNSKLSQ